MYLKVSSFNVKRVLYHEPPIKGYVLMFHEKTDGKKKVSYNKWNKNEILIHLNTDNQTIWKMLDKKQISREHISSIDKRSCE